MLRILFTLALAAMPLPMPGQARRIVSTSPSITETLFALGLGQRVVGVTNYCHYPPEADTKTRIGTFLHPDVEAIVALHPDLVVVERLPNRLREQLQRLNLRSIEVEHSTLEDVYKSDELIEKAPGVPEAGDRLNRELRRGIDDVRQRSAHLNRPSVVFIVGHTPSQLQDLFVAGGRSYFTEILEIAGAMNVFGETAFEYPSISLETILRRDPDFIVEAWDSQPEKTAGILRLWQKEQSLRAVRNHHVLVVPEDVFEVPGPRVIEACRDLAHALHPELNP
jgi:iron complex transport system substrate-binding protein